MAVVDDQDRVDWASTVQGATLRRETQRGPVGLNHEIVDGDLQRLVRRLFGEILQRIPISPEDLPVVLELEVEGHRCIMFVETPAGAHDALSPREHEIAQLVGQGYPNKTIAVRLGISSWTVSTHLRRMFAKLGVNSRAALVARVLEEEFVFDVLRVLKS